MTSIAEALEVARTQALTLLTDTITVQREAEPVTDKWGSTLPPTTATVYEGPGLVQTVANSRQTTVIVSGEKVTDVTPFVVKLPISADIKAGDWITVTKATDPALPARRWRVISVPAQSWAVLRRCPIDPAD